MPNTKTVYKDKYPTQIDFEISSESGSNVDLMMNGGAATVVIRATSSLNEYLQEDSPIFLRKDKYSMEVGKTSATTDPDNPPSVTIMF